MKGTIISPSFILSSLFFPCVLCSQKPEELLGEKNHPHVVIPMKLHQSHSLSVAYRLEEKVPKVRTLVLAVWETVGGPSTSSRWLQASPTLLSRSYRRPHSTWVCPHPRFLQ